MKEFLARWQTESPAFFKTAGVLGGIIAAIGGVFLTASLTAPEVVSAGVIKIVKAVAEVMLWVGATVLLMSKITVADTQELQNKIDEKNTNAGK
jgi:formate-dependent nitrite reductase membrane component NrfD